MYLNVGIQPNNLIRSSANNFLLELFNKISASSGTLFELDYDFIGPLTTMIEFFSNYYEKIDLDESITNSGINIKTQPTTTRTAL